MSDKEITYPVDVYLNGRKVGTMDRKGVVTLSDYKDTDVVLEMLQKNAVGIMTKDSKGVAYKDGAVHISTLGNEEDAKMENHRIKLNKKKGRIL